MCPAEWEREHMCPAEMCELEGSLITSKNRRIYMLQNIVITNVAAEAASNCGHAVTGEYTTQMSVHVQLQQIHFYLLHAP